MEAISIITLIFLLLSVGAAFFNVLTGILIDAFDRKGY
jgi:hypothetical protein